MIRKLAPTFVLATSLFGLGVSAQIPPAPAPDVTALFASDTFSNGQSTAVGGTLIKFATSYALEGPYDGSGSVYNPCTASTDPDDWEKCDDLRIGAMIGPRGGNGNQCTADISVLVDPKEDGAFLVKNRLNNIQNEAGSTFCKDMDIRPHDVNLKKHAEYHFPDGASADSDDLDRYWSRPRLRFATIGEIPQTNKNNTGDRVIKTLRQACYDFDGAGGILPSIPTWVVFERKPDHDAFMYASLLAAAGGTGEACYPSSATPCNNDNQCGAGEFCSPRGRCTCDPSDPDAPVIDVCQHIEDGRTESQIRADMAAGRYGAGPGSNQATTGMMGFGESNSANGQSKYIDCHIAGNNSPNCKNDGSEPVPTDLLGILSCVRQLPRGLSADDAYIVYCTDPTNTGSCTVLSEENGNIEWMDTRKTLFLVKGVDCNGVSVTDCDAGAYCNTGLGGRCAPGVIECSTGFEVCEPIFTGFPEICNGLDDDCDGRIDNMKDSWDDPDHSAYSLPSDHEGLDCNRLDVCSCPDGETDNHRGQTFASYLDNWDPICQCGEGLESDTTSSFPESEFDSDPQASCAAVGADDGVPAMFLALIALGFAPLMRRRR